MNNSSKIYNEKSSNIVDLFKTMANSPFKYSHSSLALSWLKTHNYFLGFVNGNYLPQPTTLNENLKKKLYDADVEVTFQSASAKELEIAAINSLEGFKRWQQFDAEAKSKVLYKIAQLIEQHNKLINGVENLTPVGRLKEKYNVPYLIDSFNYYAGLVGDAEFYNGWNSIGVVCIIIEEIYKPVLFSTLWRICALLAAGNAVLILNCDESLSAFLLAELCNTAGLPSGLINVLCYDESSFAFLSKVNKVILLSSAHKQLISVASNLCVPCEILPYRRPCMIIYENTDLDAATDGILEMLLSGVEGVWPNCRLYLQESILEKFIQQLGRKICNTISVVTANYPPFLSIMANAALTEQLLKLMIQGISEDAKTIYSRCTSVTSEFEKQCIHAVVISFNENSKQDQIQVGKCCPGVYIEPFRTIKESITMFNTDKLGLDVSIWTEDMCLALEVAHKLQTKTVWINSKNLFEPAVSYGSLYLSGNSIIGGKEGFFSHLTVLKENKENSTSNECMDIKSYGAETPVSNINLTGSKEEKKIEKSMKLYIGGSFINSSDETVQIISDAKSRPYAYIASANKSDVQKAVLSAISSQAKWQKLSKLKRSALIRKASELLNKKSEEFLSELCTVTGCQKEICVKEIEKAVHVLYFWANYITHFEDNVTEAKLYGKVLQERYPIGVIGIQSPDKEPLLSFIFLITPAIIFGNSVVAIASEKYPTLALKMCEVFQAAGLPSGVLNVIGNSRAYLTRHLASHLSIDALWFSTDGGPFIYNTANDIQQKKIFDCQNLTNDLSEAIKGNFVLQSTYSKSVYMLMGTDFIE